MLRGSFIMNNDNIHKDLQIVKTADLIAPYQVS